MCEQWRTRYNKMKLCILNVMMWNSWLHLKKKYLEISIFIEYEFPALSNMCIATCKNTQYLYLRIGLQVLFLISADLLLAPSWLTIPSPGSSLLVCNIYSGIYTSFLDPQQNLADVSFSTDKLNLKNTSPI